MGEQDLFGEFFLANSPHLQQRDRKTPLENPAIIADSKKKKYIKKCSGYRELQEREEAGR